MKMRFTLLFLAAFFLAVLPGRADREKSHPRQRENRFLFIIDDSLAMRGYSNQIARAVGELMDSDMRGEFRKGDTIGLWTYNDKLDMTFPMQVWSEADKSAVMSEMDNFLEGQTSEKQSNLQKVMPALREVIKASDRLTVILMFDGVELIHGTPFDREINNLQKRYGRELRASHLPFILVLAAREGAIFDYTINYPGLVAIPRTATPEVLPVTNAPVVAAAPPVIAAPPPKPRPSRSFIMTAPANVVPVPKPAPVIPPPAVVAAPPQPVIPAKPEPVPAQPVPPPVVAGQKPEPVKEIPPPQAPAPVAPVVVQTPPPPVTPVALTPPAPALEPSANSQLALFIIAFSLLTIAVVLVVFLIRRSRRAPQSSLISQSINRPR